MNKKKISESDIWILCSLLVLTLFLSGCAKKDPLERLDMAFDRSAKMETATQTFDLQIFFDASASSPEFDMVKNMLDGMKITGSMDVDQKAMNFAGKMKMEFLGMSYELELYKEKEYFLKMPLLDKYIIIMDQEESAEFFNEELLTSMRQDMMDIILSKLNQENTEAREEQQITQEEETIKVTPIAISLNDEEAKEIFAELMQFIFENPQMKDQMRDNMKMQLEATGESMTDEEIDAIAEEAAAQMDQAMDMIRRSVTIEKLEAVYYLDKNNDIRKTDMDYTIKVDFRAMAAGAMHEPRTEEALEEELIPMAGQSVTLRFVGTSDILNINKPLTLKIPELTPENSVGMEGLAELPF